MLFFIEVKETLQLCKIFPTVGKAQWPNLLCQRSMVTEVVLPTGTLGKAGVRVRGDTEFAEGNEML